MLRLGTVRTGRGNEIAYMELGADAPEHAPVLFVHPLNLRKECWTGLASRLVTDRRCITVDLAGHGESSDALDADLELWVTDCEDVARALELDRFHVVGGSLGGTIALCLASDLPDQVLSVTALGSAIGDEPERADHRSADPFALLDTGSVEEMFAVLAVEALAPRSPESLVTTVRRLTNSHGAPMIRQILHAAHAADATAWLSGVRCPVLVITGEFDETCAPEAGARLARLTHGSYETLPGVGHLPMLEADEAVLRLLGPHFEAAESKVWSP